MESRIVDDKNSAQSAYGLLPSEKFLIALMKEMASIRRQARVRPKYSFMNLFVPAVKWSSAS